jgi:hypothetical protein
LLPFVLERHLLPPANLSRFDAGVGTPTDEILVVAAALEIETARLSMSWDNICLLLASTLRP